MHIGPAERQAFLCKLHVLHGDQVTKQHVDPLKQLCMGRSTLLCPICIT